MFTKEFIKEFIVLYSRIVLFLYPVMILILALLYYHNMIMYGVFPILFLILHYEQFKVAIMFDDALLDKMADEIKDDLENGR